MDIEAALKLTDELVFAQTGKRLNDLQKTIFRGAWQGQKYLKVADSCHLTEGHIKDVASDLWKLLSDVLGERITRGNFRAALERRWKAQHSEKISSAQDSVLDTIQQSALEPNLVGTESGSANPTQEETEAITLIYVERPPIESVCYEKLLQPGSLIRLKAAKGMGKTLLMNRIFAQVQFQGYQTVRLSLLRANEADIKNLDKFLRWFCTSIGRQLQQYHQVDNYESDEGLSSNDNCTAYLEECLLAKIDRPLVLGLDNVDRVFPHLAVAQDFFPLLRAWHEDGKFIEIWQKLRLVVAYSTEVYISLNIDQSPFNVGEEIELPEFSEEQVQDFAARHQLNWNTAQVQQLIDMVGGHPLLVQQALSHLRSHPDVTLEQLLQTAPTEAGIYRNHLRKHLSHLLQHPELAIAFKKVVTATSSVRLDSESTYKLHSMGLVNLQGNELTIQCNLYRQYFCDRLAVT
ncbi:AAA-like domain-containing protein [Coleofasciculus sp. FACHB-SPT36]|uniref:AAA-like domain-containing protein n=1 Tax=Cyanophyceae TaxID=3028117 RepID=UPI00168AF84C|nr:AAA-like domain-containing protein [Coleofasciculus sp. FACHB-SPT36]MBD2537646.1 AAA-like domain-containing protein [Coleofasciculus sp. FACHB-SPT36]